MKQSGRGFYCLLLVVLMVQLVNSLAVPISANAQSYRLSQWNHRPLIGTTTQVPDLSEDTVPESEPETNPGPPEPPESFPEDPVEPAPGEDETEGSQESSSSAESSSSEDETEAPNESSTMPDETSTESDSIGAEDETKTALPVNQIAPGSLMIKPANVLEPINIGLTVKRLVSKHYDVAIVSMRSGILIAHYLLIPAGESFVPYFSSYLIAYFESLLKVIIQA